MPLPKTIHYCWFGGGQKTELIERCIASWKKYAPDCEIIEWNENNYDVTKNPYMKEAFEAKRWSFVSDYARLDIVYEHGGIYFDTDVELIRPIDDLLSGTGFIGFEQADQNGQYFVNSGGGFGALPYDSIIKKMRDYYNELSFLNHEGKENLQPCPKYNTEAMKEYGLVCDNKQQRVGNISIYPADWFCPVNWKSHHCETTENTYSIHHFDASWLGNKEKKHRRRERIIDGIVHLPNKIIKSILGERKYTQLKRRIRKEKEK